MNELNAELESFKKWLEQFSITERTINEYAKVVEHFYKNTSGELTQYNVNLYIKKMRNFLFYSAMKKYLKFKGLDFELQKPKYKRKSRVEPPSLNEIKDIISNINNKELYWVLKIGIYTGARIHEILSLKLKDIIPEESAIIFRKTKTGDEHKVYLKKEIIDELIHYLKEEKGILNNQRCFFTNSKSIHSAYVYLRKLIKKEIKDPVLVKKLMRTHNIRRSVINYILEKTNMNILVAKEFIGHKSYRTTERYISEITKEKAKKVVAEQIMG